MGVIEPIEEPLPEPEPVPEEPQYVDPAEYTAEDWLDVLERFLHDRLEPLCAEIATLIRETRMVWKRRPPTEEEKVAMVDDANALLLAVKEVEPEVPLVLREWDVPDVYRKPVAVVAVDAEPIEREEPAPIEGPLYL